MRLLTLLFVILCMLADVSAKKKNSKVKKSRDARLSTSELENMGEKRLEQITNLEKQSPADVIQFTPKTYRELVLKNPRPYDVVVLFSVKTNCKVCEEVSQEFDQTVFSFVQERGINKDFSKEKKIFFGVLYFSQDMET